MNNSLLDVFLSKERKRFNLILQLIDQKNYQLLIEMDKDEKFGLTNQKFVDRVLERLDQEATNPEFLIKTYRVHYFRTEGYILRALKANPNMIETLIEGNINDYDNKLMLFAIENGYVPSDDYFTPKNFSRR